MDTTTDTQSDPTDIRPPENPTDRIGTLLGPIGRYVNHDRLLVRLVSVWLLGMVVFFGAWILSYYFLPAGILRGGLGANAPVVAEGVPETFLRIFAWNLVFGALLVIGAGLFRSVRTPMSYPMLVVVWAQGGIVYGTNSLAIEAGRLAPSIGTALGRSGMFEFTAYAFVAVATRGWMVWHQRSPPRHREEFERVRSPREWDLSRGEAVVLVLGIAILALANLREAIMIHQVLG